jgi:DNA-binding NarL/FixJ family response regulator
MKTFLMTMAQKPIDQHLFAILKSMYEDLNIYTASTEAEIELLLKTNTYDLAIIHSGLDALALSSELIGKALSMPILVYTETNYIPYIKKLYGLGVSGVLNVGSSEQELSKAVTDVLAKRIYMSESLKESLLISTKIDDFNYGTFKTPYLLTPYLTAGEIAYEMPLTFINGNMLTFTQCLN